MPVSNPLQLGCEWDGSEEMQAEPCWISDLKIGICALRCNAVEVSDGGVIANAGGGEMG